MNNLYDEYIINVLEKEIKETKRKLYKNKYFFTKSIYKKHLDKLQLLLNSYYQKYYNIYN